MSRAIDLLHDIVGINDAGVECHPFKGRAGPKSGYFSYTFKNDNKTFMPVTEQDLRGMIEKGAFNARGRVRMVPASAQSTSGAGALRVVKYRGRPLPL